MKNLSGPQRIATLAVVLIAALVFFKVCVFWGIEKQVDIHLSNSISYSESSRLLRKMDTIYPEWSAILKPTFSDRVSYLLRRSEFVNYIKIEKIGPGSEYKIIACKSSGRDKGDITSFWFDNEFNLIKKSRTMN